MNERRGTITPPPPRGALLLPGIPYSRYNHYEAMRVRGIILLLLDVLRRLRTSPPPPPPPTGFGRAHFPLVFGGEIPNPDRAEHRRGHGSIAECRTFVFARRKHGTKIGRKAARVRIDFNAGTQFIKCNF